MAAPAVPVRRARKSCRRPAIRREEDRWDAGYRMPTWAANHPKAGGGRELRSGPPSSNRGCHGKPGTTRKRLGEHLSRVLNRKVGKFGGHRPFHHPRCLWTPGCAEPPPAVAVSASSAAGGRGYIDCASNRSPARAFVRIFVRCSRGRSPRILRNPFRPFFAQPPPCGMIFAIHPRRAAAATTRPADPC